MDQIRGGGIIFPLYTYTPYTPQGAGGRWPSGLRPPGVVNFNHMKIHKTTPTNTAAAQATSLAQVKAHTSGQGYSLLATLTWTKQPQTEQHDGR